MTQSNALRLADALLNQVETNGDWSQEQVVAAAAELRRLHDLAFEQQGKIYALEMARSMEQKTAKLKRDALLEAAKEAEPMLQAMLDNIRKTLPQYTKLPALDKLSAAIKAVEGEKA